MLFKKACGGVKVIRRVFWGFSIIVLSVVVGLASGCCPKKAVVAPEQPVAPAAEAVAAPEPAPAPEQKVEPVAAPAGLTEIEIFESEKIFFDFDQAELKPDARTTLEKKADWLRANPAASCLIEGNCDERGTVEYNLALGERRANSAKKFLVDLGIDAGRISTVSYGEEKPVDPGHTEEAWAKNRRDEFKVQGK